MSGGCSELARPCSVSTSRSSNRACGFLAHGSPTGFSRQHTKALSRLGRDSENIALFAGRYSSFRDRLVVIGVDRQKPISGLLVSSRNAPQVRLLSSTGITRLLQYYEPVRHPTRPSLLLTEFQLRTTTSHRRGFPCFGRSPLPGMPTPLPRRNRWVLSLSRPAAAAFP